jgi:hypothetical protein
MFTGTTGTVPVPVAGFRKLLLVTVPKIPVSSIPARILLANLLSLAEIAIQSYAVVETSLTIPEHTATSQPASQPHGNLMGFWTQPSKLVSNIRI